MTSVEVVGADSASFYVMVDPIGGIEIGHEEYDEYDALSRAMNGRFFMLHLTPAESDDLPTLAYQDLLTSANELDGQGDRTFTWAEAAIWAFDLLSAHNKDNSYPLNRGAYAGTGAEKAIAYLDSYGMLYGYEEGFLPPTSPSRAQTSPNCCSVCSWRAASLSRTRVGSETPSRPLIWTRRTGRMTW